MIVPVEFVFDFFESLLMFLHDDGVGGIVDSKLREILLKLLDSSQNTPQEITDNDKENRVSRSINDIQNSIFRRVENN